MGKSGRNDGMLDARNKGCGLFDKIELFLARDTHFCFCFPYNGDGSNRKNERVSNKKKIKKTKTAISNTFY